MITRSDNTKNEKNTKVLELQTYLSISKHLLPAATVARLQPEGDQARDYYDNTVVLHGCLGGGDMAFPPGRFFKPLQVYNRRLRASVHDSTYCRRSSALSGPTWSDHYGGTYFEVIIEHNVLEQKQKKTKKRCFHFFYSFYAKTNKIIK